MHTSIILRQFFALILCCTVGAKVARATPPHYVVTDLGAFPDAHEYSLANSINGVGQVTGWSRMDRIDYAFLWQPSGPNSKNGAMMELKGMPGTPLWSYGYKINASGQVAISSFLSGAPNTHGFLWTPNSPNATTGSAVDIGDLPGGQDVSEAHAINNYGQVVGWSRNDFGDRAFLWKPNTPNGSAGDMVDLGDLPGGTTVSQGFGINAGGQVVGYSNTTDGDHAFLWKPNTSNGLTGTMVDLGSMPGSNRSIASSINSSGKVVGGFGSTGSTQHHAFAWTPDLPNGLTGTMVDLGDLPGGLEESSASAINDAGLIVGSGNGTSNRQRAILWTPQDGLLDLNTLIGSDSVYWSLQNAFDINEFGQIVGLGNYARDGANDTFPQLHGFLLTPIPEPSSVVLLLVSVATVLVQRGGRCNLL